MTTCTYNCLMNVINIGNSIIGVSILAMPYCFRKCGILLSIILIFLSGLLTRLACYLLLKSAIMARRRNFEFLAFHTFGTTGKLAVEISVIGFLIGVCIAFFVVIGDLGPPLAAEFFYLENSSNLRTKVLIMVGLCVALPLGMLRKIDSLTSLSALSIAFYGCLIIKIFAEAVPNLAANEWWHQVNWWQSDGILPCLPIFSMALSCQTQLFEFFDTLNDPSLKRMQSAINGAVYLCSTVYMSVGTLGYIAFHNKVITGNILVFLTPSVVTEIIKLGFLITIAVSFPLCLFPCRSSLHSLLFKQGFGHHDLAVTVIPELRFRVLTVGLVIITIGVAIMLPNIEFVLGIIGSTIGTLICLIFPAMMFIHDTSKDTTEKRLAQILMAIGAFILIACTYSTLQDTGAKPQPVANQIQAVINHTPQPIISLSSAAIEDIQQDQKRLEPPIPQEPDIKGAALKQDLKANIQQKAAEIKAAAGNADLDPQALKKEDKEIQKESGVNIPFSSTVADAAKKDLNIEKQEKILQKLEQQQQEQQLILEQQKKVLEELKLHKESHEDLRKKEKKQTPSLDPGTVSVNLMVEKHLNQPNPKDIDIKESLKLADLIKSSALPRIIKNYDLTGNVSKVLPKEDIVLTEQLKEPNIPVGNSLKGYKKVPHNYSVTNIRSSILAVNLNNSVIAPQELARNNEPDYIKLKPKVNINPEKISDAHINRREPLENKREETLALLVSKEAIDISNLHVQDENPLA